MAQISKAKTRPNGSVDELAALVRRCRRGDALAWEALVRRFQNRIFGLAYHYVRDREEARDLAQEIFVRVYRGLNSFRDDTAFPSWLIKMARNCCIDRLRRLKARPKSTDQIQPEMQDFADDNVNVHEQLELASRRQLLYRALTTMSDHGREIIILKDIHGLKLTEISEMLAIPLGTVKSRSGRARVELAKAILAIDPSYGARA